MILILIVASGCIIIGESFQNLSNNSNNLNNSGNGTYSAHGVSFNYPSNWSVVTDKEDENTIQITASPIYLSSNFTSFWPFQVCTVATTSPDNAQFQVQISNDSTSNQLVTQIGNVVLDHNMKKISSGTLTIDGKKAYEETFTTNYSNGIGIMRDEEIGFVKNRNAYIIYFEVKDEDFDKEKQNFDIILNSFKAQ